MTYSRGNFLSAQGTHWRIVRTSRRWSVVRAKPESVFVRLKWVALKAALLALILGFTLLTPSSVVAATGQIGAAEISAALPSALNLPSGGMGETSIILDNSYVTLAAPDGRSGQIEFTRLNYDNSTRRFAGVAELRDGTALLAQASISGRVITEIDVPVMARSLQRDEVISARDLIWQRVALNTSTQQAYTRAEDIIGKTPRTALRAGQLLRAADLTVPAIIKRGTLVTLLYQAGNLQLTAKGRALNDAASGELVRLAATSSARTLEGIARPDGSVILSNSLTN